jgi:hypothetical protein
VNDLSAQLRALANQVPRADFVARTQGRYLMVAAAVAAASDLGFDTRVGSHGRLLQAAMEAGGRRILALEKTDRSPFSNISVGRARNCDVVLREPSVSKLHAHFLVSAAGWQLVDRGSANGTFHKGRKLDADHPVLLAPGDEILIGAVSCVFADAVVLFRELGPD